MGGNAIAHLMPPPFYAYRHVVAKARAPEESVQDAIDKIVDATATKRYKVEVMPGRYPEVITMAPWIDVVAPYGKVIIQPTSGDAGVTMASNCMLQGVEVNQTNQGENATAIVIEADNENVIVEDCWVTGGGAGDIGISDASTGTVTTGPVIRKCRIDSAATGYKKTGTEAKPGGTSWFYDNRVTCCTDGTDVDVDDGTLNMLDCELMGGASAVANVRVDVTGAHTTTVNSWGNTLSGTGWSIGNDHDAEVYSHDDKYTLVTHDGVGFMVDYESPQSYNVFNGMHIADALEDITDAGDLKRYVILVHPGEYDEAVEMKHHIDLVGESNQSCVISQASATVLNAAANSRVRSIRFELMAAEGVRCIEVDGVAARFEDCIVVVTGVSEWNHGIHTMNGGTVTLYDCHVTCSGTTAYALTLTNASRSTLYNCSFSGSDDTYDIFLTSAATVDAYNCQLLNNGWYIGDYADVFARAYNCDFTEVTFEGTHGAFADLSGCRLYACDSALTIGDWVYAVDDDTVAETDADDLSKMPTIGVINYKPDDDHCYVKNYGYYYDVAMNAAHGSVFVAGEEYWVSGTDGQITTTMHPVWPQRAGVAVDTQRFKILIGDNLGLVHCNEYLCTHNAVVHDSTGIGAWVYKTNGVPPTPGAENDLVALAKANAEGTMPAIGVCVARIAVGDGGPDTLLIKLRGKYSMTKPADEGNFYPGDDIFIDPDVLGQITSDRPVGDIVQKVAEVKSCDGTLIYEIAD